MGGGGGGEQKTQQTQNTTNTSEPSPVIQGPLKGIVRSMEDYYKANPNAPDFFAGNPVADPSMATRAGWDALSNVGHNGLGYGIDPANRRLTAETLGGKFLDPTQNPYLQKYLRAGFDEQNESFGNVVVPNLRSQFAGAGRTSYTPAGADFETTMRATKDLSKTQANAAAGAESDAYKFERGMQSQTQSMLPSFLGMNLTRANAIGQAGREIDDWTQRNIDAQILRDTYNKTKNLNYWSDAASRFLGAYPGGVTTGTGTTTGTSMGGGGGGSSGAGLASAGMGLAGAGLMAAATFA